LSNFEQPARIPIVLDDGVRGGSHGGQDGEKGLIGIGALVVVASSMRGR
jgi:hypothetical protein